MKYFRRILTRIFVHHWSLAGIVFSSFLIALTWGANIGTVYPIFDLVLRGDSLKNWAQQRLESSTDLTNQGLTEQVRSWNDWGLQILIDHAPTQPLTTLQLIVGWIVIASVFRFLAVVIHSVLVTKVVGQVTNSLREQFFDSALGLDLKSFQKYNISDLINHVNHDLGQVSSGISFIVLRTVTEPMKIIVCVIGAAFISWQLLLLLAVVVPVGMLTMHFLAKSIRERSNQISEKMAEVCRRLHLSFLAMPIVKAYNLEEYQKQKLNTVSEELVQSSIRYTLINQYSKVISESFVIAVTSVALLVGGFMVLDHRTHVWGIRLSNQPLTAGAMIAFFAFLLGTHQPFRRLSELFSGLQNSEAAAKRFFAIIDQKPGVSSPENPAPFPDSSSQLVFDKVSFEYLTDHPVLNDVEITISPGDTVAVVGVNGSGKSTLVNLLTRFFDPTSGSIRYGGTDLRDLSLLELREHIGLVTQSPTLFGESVEANIRFGRPAATQEEIIAAAKQANAHEFIENVLENGYATNIGEQGKRLSGGQRQRIALARAMLRDPRVLILDEPTSAVDMQSEAEIHQALRSFMPNRITILITHHLPSLQLANRIVVLDSGRVVESGTHSELLNRSDVYRKLFLLQKTEAA